MVPAIAFAILIVGGALALVVDRLWLDNARIELTAATEAAALTAANQIADDELLRPNADLSALVENARLRAADVAARNMVNGTPLELRTEDDGDIQFGRIVQDAETGKERFLETDYHPTSVVVFGGRNRSRGNPIALFFRQLTGQTTGDLIVSSEASIDNRIVGVRPYKSATTPAIPIALLDKDPDPKRVDTWTQQIDLKLGVDEFGFNPVTDEVTEGPDGIPEMLAYGAPENAKEEEVQKANLHLVDVGTGLQPIELQRQFEKGWDQDDMIDFGGEFRTDEGPVSLKSNAILDQNAQQDLQALVGQSRICLLYVLPASKSKKQGASEIEATRLVAVRIMKVRQGTKKSLEVTVQPTVVTTRTALVSEPGAVWSADPDAVYASNPYIYKLFLTQ